MLLSKATADAFGVLTIGLFMLLFLLSLFCIIQSIYFRFHIQKVGFLRFFSGPWITRITFILITIWWGIGEVLRLHIVRARLFNFFVQRTICKVYILSNLGFAEPGLFFVLVYLLHGSLQRRDIGTLSPHWNGKTILYISLWCVPVFIMQSLLILALPDALKDGNPRHRLTKIDDYFVRTSYMVNGDRVCTYPLIATLFLGIVDVCLMTYVSYLGSQVLMSVINRGLQKRVSWLMSTVIIFIPMRVVLLGFSVMANPGDVTFEVLVFLSFLMMCLCLGVGIVMLVYYPIADSLKLRELGDGEIDGEIAEAVPYERAPQNDFYASQSSRELDGVSEESSRTSTLSMCAMLKPNNHR